MRHSPEIRHQALASIEKNGVKKTHEDMKISMQTLYKWKNEEKKAKAPSAAKGAATAPKKKAAKKTEAPAADDRQAAARNLIHEDDENLLKKIAQIEAENAELRIMNDNLKKALKAFVE